MKIIDLLKAADNINIDELNFRSGISSSVMSTALLNLEMRGLLQALPGKRFRLIDN